MRQGVYGELDLEPQTGTERSGGRPIRANAAFQPLRSLPIFLLDASPALVRAQWAQQIDISAARHGPIVINWRRKGLFIPRRVLKPRC